MSLNVLTYAHEQLTPMLKSSPSTSSQIGGHQHQITSVLSTVAVSAYPDVTSGYITAPNDLPNITPYHAMEHLVATPPYLFALLSLLLLSLIAALIPQSSEDGLARIRNRLSMLQSSSNFLHIPMSRGVSSCNSSSSTVPPKSGQSRTRGGQKGQKRPRSVSDGSKSGGQDPNDGGQDPNGGGEEPNDKPVKKKNLNGILFMDEQKPFGCPYYWRRPDMWAACGYFRRAGKEVHRLKDHLNAYHKLEYFYDYICPNCHQPFQLESVFVAHNRIFKQTGFCQADETRDYLRGFDDVQAAQLTKSATSQFSRDHNLSDVDKWKKTFSILFPDVEESGIPDPLHDPTWRDTSRHLQSSGIIVPTTPGNFNDWRRTQPSKNLSLQQIVHSGPSPSFSGQMHDAPTNRDDHLIEISTGTQAINQTYPFSPEGVRGPIPSFTVNDHELLPNLDDSGERISHHHYLDPNILSQFDNMPGSILSPRRQFRPPSNISSNELRASQGGLTWASSTQDSAPSMHNPPGTSQIVPSYSLPEFFHENFEIDEAQFGVLPSPSAEDHVWIGEQFPKGMTARTSNVDQGNTSKSPG